MQCIVATSGSSGDLYPYLNLALGLRARGHQVRMLVPAMLQDAVRASGLECHSFGSLEEAQAVLANPAVWDDIKGMGLLWRSLVPHLGCLRDLVLQLAPEPCVLLCHPLLLPMADVARAVRPDLRIVAGYLAPANLCSSHDVGSLWRLPQAAGLPPMVLRGLWRAVHHYAADPQLLPSLNQGRAALQLPPVAHFFEHLMSTPDVSIGLFPSWFASVQPDWPQPFVEADFVQPPLAAEGAKPLAEPLQRFLQAGPPPVLCTAGTAHWHASAFFEAALQALQKLGRRGLFITRQPGQLPQQLPDSVLWQDQAPFAQLLPHCAAIVHHGGIGTLAEGVRAGLPQLIVPNAYDQFDNGYRLRRMGMGEVVQAKRLTPLRLQRYVGRLLASDSLRQTCAAAAQRMRDVPAHQVLDQVEATLFVGK